MLQPGKGFTCGEVRGGNGVTHHLVELPGLRGVLYSRPCEGAHGGDIHYLSKCGSGLMSRVCLADVAGHGEAVSAIGRGIHDHLRRSVDVIDERKVLSRFNERLNAEDVRAMTTVVLATYYPPRRASVGQAVSRRDAPVGGTPIRHGGADEPPGLHRHSDWGRLHTRIHAAPLYGEPG